MIRRQILRFIWGVSFAICTTITMAAETNVQVALKQIADSYEQEYFANFPEQGVLFGYKNTPQNKFNDHTWAAHQAWEHTEDIYLARLLKINEKSLRNTPQYITYRLLKETLENNKTTRICYSSLWNINPMTGWHVNMTTIAEKQPVGTDALRALALERWRTFGIVVTAEINNLKLGLAKGYSAPKSAVKRVITQINILLAYPPEKSPFYDFARRDNDPKFKREVASLIKNKINPALKKYMLYLEKEYLPQARTEIGLSSIPNGEACYQAKIKQNTTLNIKPQTIYQLGQKQMQYLIKKVALLGEQEFGIKSMRAVFYTAKNQPKYLFSSEADILAYNLTALKKAQSHVGAWFINLPKSEAIIKPYPEYLANTGAGGEYFPPSDDGSVPGIFYINTAAPNKKSRVDVEATLFHELIPGHHFQMATMVENKTHHNLDQYLWNFGFVEGWALYAEGLADTMGLYRDRVSRIGMLSNESLRAARLVVDPGIHIKHWTRNQAINYLKAHSTLSDTVIENEVDRYTMNPGQAVAYLIGKFEIERLRDEYKAKLKEKFDIRVFHEQVLKNGAVTLSMLREQVISSIYADKLKR